MQGKITIEVNIPEKDYLEHLLNLHYSGKEVSLGLVLYAFAESWKLDKLQYYWGLFE